MLFGVEGMKGMKKIIFRQNYNQSSAKYEDRFDYNQTTERNIYLILKKEHAKKQARRFLKDANKRNQTKKNIMSPPTTIAARPPLHKVIASDPAMFHANIAPSPPLNAPSSLITVNPGTFSAKSPVAIIDHNPAA